MTHKGSFKELAELTHSDPLQEDLFSQAKLVFNGVQPPEFFRNDVALEHDFKLVVSKSLIGIPRAAYQALHGVTPEEAGHSLLNLRDINDAVYRGVLAVDPACPFYRYSLSREVSLNRRENVLAQERHSYKDQAKDVEDKRREKLEESNAMYVKFRTCSLTMEQMSADVRGMKPSSAAASSSAALPSHHGTASASAMIGSKGRVAAEVGSDEEDEDDDSADAVETRTGATGQDTASSLAFSTSRRQSSLLAKLGSRSKDFDGMSVVSGLTARSGGRTRSHAKDLETQTPQDCS